MRSHLVPRILVVLAAALFTVAPASAHVVFNELELLTGPEAGWYFLKQGYLHILPLGFDHILFVLSLYLLSPKWKTILWQATAFTVAHSITLGLAMYGVLAPPPAIVEPLIAISIMAVALENILSQRLSTSRISVVFLFGLIHGMGFAGALADLGLPRKHFLTTLLTFNLGVELGQISVILLAFLLIGLWFQRKPYYHTRVVIPLSVAILLIAGYWTVERIFFA
ncbi:MAG TPA: HupE/UreJ family protein [Flavobacteriales bacterium]|nr:HupE/UreJ family protein [Flavobacteriales bacterium]